MKKTILFVLAVVAMLCSCSNGKTKVSATGSIYDLLVVMNDDYWKGASGDSVRAYLEADMPCMPQMEPYFTLSHTPLASFDDAFMATRNILIVDIDPHRYTQCKVSYKTDVYSHPQAVAVVHIPSAAEAANYLGSIGAELQNFFLRQELERQAAFYKTNYNHDAEELIEKKFGVALYVPIDYQVIMEDSDFVWCCADNGPKRRDLVVWSYPYTDPNTFTCEFLCQKRDSMLHRVSAYVEGTYMGTEYKIFPPEYKGITVHNAYCGELRGLWKMKGGAAMGGPFVEHTRIDETTQRIITVESFIYAPGQKKRNAYRQAEAALYTLTLPQDANPIQDVDVVADK